MRSLTLNARLAALAMTISISLAACGGGAGPAS